MTEESTTLYVLVAVCVVAVVGLGLGVASVATNESMAGMMGGGGGGMMGGTGGTTTAAGHPGLFEWTVLLVSIVFFIVAAGLLIQNRSRSIPAQPLPAAPPVFMAPAAPVAPAPEASVEPTSTSSSPAPVPEPTLVKLLNEDERRMYLEIRSHGGTMLQRDLVALGTFSKAKVTRVLDKLEAKGLVVREAHGMTNRVRLTGGVAR